MKEAINQRFIEAVNAIISCNKEYNKAKIAAKLNIKPSKFSEILNKRMNISIDSILLFSDIFVIPLDWLLMGKGSIDHSYIKEENPPDSFKELAESRKETIELLRGKVMSLEKEVLELREKINIEESINASVQRGAVESLNEPKLGEKIGK
ncbi:hypothetical protein [Flavobacterium laiguense]|uniref:HTH cro/C1-type domain-containing protein n=1 Tax=Flavobacterium laiguense TaxID=2169409 RepID=A0A2U1K118_9FLAO|nr:hypothetical protein [Flavobacterium laiguense]PWA10935.1 hypothetical protein DB891_03650 [Flavobacterium laiguense]